MKKSFTIKFPPPATIIIYDLLTLISRLNRDQLNINQITPERGDNRVL